jgi:putative lipoic acid-binding regulatory protein
MDESPSVELLENTHEFPCEYMFKAIGHAGDEFVARVVAAVREELALASDPPFRVRTATGGRHLAVTLTPQVQTGAQVLAVYRRIRRTAGLLFLW